MRRRMLFFPARNAENAEFIIGRERTDGSDRKTSEIIINLADDDKNRAERNYCRRIAAMTHFPSGTGKWAGTRIIATRGRAKSTNNSRKHRFSNSIPDE